jgi:transposase InsO family protein
VRFTDTEKYFVSEASVYRLLKAHDLIASPAFIVMKAADEFKDKTTAPNQLWQTDFTYLKVIGWGWFYLSTILDDFSRFIVAWKLCTTMKAEDVTATLDLALKGSGLSRQRSFTGQGYFPTTAPATSRPTSPNGSMARTWSMSAARLITP